MLKFVFVSVNVKYILVVVAVQFQESTVTVEEGELETLTVTLTAMADHEFDFVVNVKIMDETAERMHFTQCGFLCSVHRCFIPYHILGGSDYVAVCDPNNLPCWTKQCELLYSHS